MAESPDKNRRRDAINTVRLMCLDDESAASASRTFNLYPCDIVDARRRLQGWSKFSHATEQERVDYLLKNGWRKRSRRS